MNIYEKLMNIQQELKAPKGQFNKFGGYKYRSCEDILEAVKPLLAKYKTTLLISDELVVLGESTPTTYTEQYFDKDLKKENTRTIVIGNQRFYVKATAKLIDVETNGIIENAAYAREEESKKGMDGSQITGTASSYARKYALNGLFDIDDTKDADTDEYSKTTKQEEKEEKKATEGQIGVLNKLSEATKAKIYAKYNVGKIEDLTISQASEIISKLKKEK